MPPSPSDTRRLSKDYSREPENVTHTENSGDHIVANEVGALKSPSAERKSSDVELSVSHKTTNELPVITQDRVREDKTMRRLSSDISTRDYSPQLNNRIGRASSDVSSNKRLEEYHKWKISGCKGDPPAKLKISQ